MIKVENLTKIYKTRECDNVVALNNVSFVLENTGMIFICGKSGSGKSTLLNILAGLDDITSGDVLIDGNSLKELNIDLFDNYRSKYVGFIFQDFHLIENLTIKENIEISLNLLNEENDNSISLMLNKVGLSGYEDRFPKELSGGEKQRVAIARALIKNPRYIFADEPTGNLDYNTSINILNLLKELSKERVVVIISHDLTNAYKYADRLIELKDGNLIRDITRKDSNSSFLIENETIFITPDSILSKEEIEEINSKIKTGKYLLSQENKRFKDSIQPLDNNENNVEFKKNSNISFKKLHKLSKTFKKDNFLTTFFNALLISFLLIVLTIAQMFFSFDGSEFVNKHSQDDNNYVLYKDYVQPGSSVKANKLLIPVLEEDINNFYDLGYEGNIYKLYGYNVSTTPTPQGFADSTKIAKQEHVNYEENLVPYVQAGKGVLECDLEYLTSLYGVNGKLEYLLGSPEKTDECELIITDYFADCIKKYKGLSYEQIVGRKMTMELTEYKVKAIIDTDYEEKYKEIFDKYLVIEKTSDLKEKNQLIDELKQEETFVDFYNELNSYLSVCYFVDGDFMSSLKNDKDLNNGCWNISSKFYDMAGNALYSNPDWFGYEVNNELKKGEIILHKGAYERIYGKAYSDDLTFPFDMVLTEDYAYKSYLEEPEVKKQFKVIGVFDTPATHIQVSYEDYYDIFEVVCINYGLYFDNGNSIRDICGSNELNFHNNDPYIITLFEIKSIVEIFGDVFSILNVFIIVVIAILLINYGRTNIKKKTFEIGVVRSLGGKNQHIFLIILTQVLLLFVLVCLISFIPLMIVDDYLNQILLDGFSEFSNNMLLSNIKILNLKPSIVILNLSSIVLLTVLCSIILFRMLQKIKPINIIRKRND